MFPASMLLAVAFAQEPPVAVEAAPASRLHLVYTGASGGLGSGRLDFRVPDELTAALGELTEVRAHYGVLARGDELLLANDRQVATLVAYTQVSGVSCEDAAPTSLFQRGAERVLYSSKFAPTLAEVLGAQSVPLVSRLCTADGQVVRWIGPEGAQPPTDFTGFELRIALRSVAGGEPFEVLSLPDGDGARRVTLLRELFEQDPDALWVDAGGFLDGASSLREGSLSLHRPTALEVLHRFHPAVLVPAASELAGGAATWAAGEAKDLPYVAANWVAGEGGPALPASRTVEAAGQRVAVIGVIDPALVHLAASETVRLSEPVAAVQAEVERLRATAPAPDLIVVAAAPGRALLERLQTEVEGVDVLMGNPSPSVRRVQSFDAQLEHGPLPGRAAWTLPLGGVSELWWEPADGAAHLRAVPHAIDAAVRPDPHVLEQITAVRFAEYPALDHPLLPALASAPTAPLDEATWSRVVCEAALEYADADFAFLPRLPPAQAIPGPLTELMVASRLDALDTLEVHTFLGSKLAAMLSDAKGAVPLVCGVDLNAKSKIGGRVIDAERLYRVVTTRRAMEDGGVASLVTRGVLPRLLDNPVVWTVEDADGAPVTLNRATRAVLHDHLDQDALALLTARSPSTLRPLWIVRVGRASFGAEGFQGANDDAFSGVPESLATNASSFALSSALDVGFGYSDRKIDWLITPKAAYTRMRTTDGSSETQDDLSLSGRVLLPALAFPTGPLTWKPSAEALLDSEITPTTDDTGAQNPRQADVSLTLGFASKAGPLSFTLGAFTLRDATTFSKPQEFGGRLQGELKLDLGSGLLWKTTADTFIWGDTVAQDASDLRFKTVGDSRVQVPLSRFLAISLYGRGFWFSGRVPETKHLGSSYTLGTAIDLTGAFGW